MNHPTTAAGIAAGRYLALTSMVGVLTIREVIATARAEARKESRGYHGRDLQRFVDGYLDGYDREQPKSHQENWR